MTDRQLLRQFADDNSQAAFAEICRRYTNLVYSVCRREIGETSLAEDAAQAVFLVLARKAPGLKHRADTTLGGWLFQTALLVSRNVRCQEQRRAAREQKVMQMQTQWPAESPEWAEVEPLLNDALQALPPGQRTLIIERFLQERPLAEIGAGLGVSEDAARMRVNRALDRLRRFFAVRNITLSAAALAALLPLAVRPAPAHAAEIIARLALPTPGGTPAFILAQGMIHTMNLNRLRLQLGAAALVAIFVLGTAGAVRVTTQMKAQRVAAAEQQNQVQALAVLNQMYATYAAMKSFKCSVTSREEPLHTAQDADYEIEYPNKARFKRFTLIGGSGSGEATAVSDGRSLYVTCTENNSLVNRYAKMPAAAGGLLADFGGLPMWGTEPNVGMPFAALGERLEDEHSSQISAPTFSLGQPVVLDLPGVPGPMPFDVVIAQKHWLTPVGTIVDDPIVDTYYIGQHDHLLYKLTAAYKVSPTEWDTRTELINNMEINPKVSESDFVFTPAPGSHEVPNTSGLFPGGRG